MKVLILEVLILEIQDFRAMALSLCSGTGLEGSAWNELESPRGGWGYSSGIEQHSYVRP